MMIYLDIISLIDIITLSITSLSMSLSIIVVVSYDTVSVVISAMFSDVVISDVVLSCVICGML